MAPAVGNVHSLYTNDIFKAKQRDGLMIKWPKRSSVSRQRKKKEDLVHVPEEKKSLVHVPGELPVASDFSIITHRSMQSLGVGSLRDTKL